MVIPAWRTDTRSGALPRVALGVVEGFMALTSWLQGDLPMSRAELIDHTTDVFVLLADRLR
ncbi:hypothetical protein GCM10027089_48560 [Nocardia thraciensis]